MENNNDKLRFKDKGDTLWKFKNRVYVHCPKCDKRAIVSRDDFGNKREVKISCSNCHFRQIGWKISYDIEVKFFCSNCAERIEKRIEDVGEKKESIKVKCTKCKITHEYKPRNTKRRKWFASTGNVSDPFYNLPLWIRGQIKNETFWAYNYEHLEYLKNYVQAKLRVRSGYGYTSMVEKLPSWIKAKKNREDIVKLIEKLEKK